VSEETEKGWRSRTWQTRRIALPDALSLPLLVTFSGV